MNEKSYSVKEVAEMLNVTPKTVGRWCRTGQIGASKVGLRLWRISQVSLDEFQKIRR